MCSTFTYPKVGSCLLVTLFSFFFLPDWTSRGHGSVFDLSLDHGEFILPDGDVPQSPQHQGPRGHHQQQEESLPPAQQVAFCYDIGFLAKKLTLHRLHFPGTSARSWARRRPPANCTTISTSSNDWREWARSTWRRSWTSSRETMSRTFALRVTKALCKRRITTTIKWSWTKMTTLTVVSYNMHSSLI